jgi:hypothetical protein
MLKQLVDNLSYLGNDFILVFLLEAFNTIFDLALAVNNDEVVFMNFIELYDRAFGEFVLKSLDDIGIFELLRHGEIVDDRKH